MALAKRTSSQMAEAMKRARARAGAVAKSRQHSLVATGTAGLLGYAEGKGMKLPTVGELAPPATYGLAALAVTFLPVGPKAKQMAQSMADGMLSVAAHSYGYVQGKKDEGK